MSMTDVPLFLSNHIYESFIGSTCRIKFSIYNEVDHLHNKNDTEYF